MQAILVGLLGAIISITGVFSYGQYSQTFGALPLIQSAQLAASPTNGLVLKTNGTSNYWGTDDGGAGSGLSSYDAFTHPISGVSATTSALRITGGLNASSTVLFDNATSTLFTATTAWLTNLFIGVDTLAEYISDTAGAMFSGNTETGITVTYQDADNTIDVVCDTASGSVFGCLSTTDWTTFNSKLGAYDPFTHPAAGISATTSQIIVSATSTIGDGTYGITNNGNATTTGRLYVGPSNIATANNGPLSSGSGFGNLTMACNGCGGTTGNFLSVANFGTANGAGINTFSARGTAASPSATQASDVIYFMGGRGFGTTVWNAGSKAAIQYVASQAHTDSANGTYITLETTPNNSTTRAEHVRLDQSGNLGIGTTTPYAKLSVVGSTGVVAGKYTATSTGTINESAFQNITFTNGTGTNATTTAFSATHAAISTTFSLFGTAYTTLAALGNALVNAVTAVTPTGTWDFGGATSVEIPNGTGPTVDATGELAVDTTAGQFAFYDGVADRRLMATTTKSFNIASTTLDALGNSFSLGTTTFTLMNSGDPLTLLGFYCQASTTGTAIIRFGDGVNWTTEQVCTSGAYTVTTSNNTFTAFEAFMLQASSTIGTTNRITVTPHFRFTSQ